MSLLAKKRGLFYVIYLFFKGIMRGNPVYIGIAVAILAIIIGWAVYKSRSGGGE
jgi:hypothetical protein